MIQYKIDFENLEWETPMEGTACKSYVNGGKRIRLIRYTKVMPPHWCATGHFGYVLDGQLEIEYPNEKHVYQKGDGVFIPDGEEHRHKGRVIGDSATVIFIEDV